MTLGENEIQKRKLYPNKNPIFVIFVNYSIFRGCRY